jgi:hypothetical protein
MTGGQDCHAAVDDSLLADAEPVMQNELAVLSDKGAARDAQVTRRPLEA